MVLGVFVLFIPLSCFSFYPPIFVLSFSNCFMLGWVGLGGVDWCNNVLHLHTHLLLRHTLFFLLCHKNFSSTSTSSARYAKYLSCCYVLRSSLALPYLLRATLNNKFLVILDATSQKHLLELMLCNDSFSCASNTTSNYFTYIYIQKTCIYSNVPQIHQKDVKQVCEVLEGLSKKHFLTKSLQRFCMFFLISISYEILQNHHFVVILKITMNPKHLQTHGPLEAPAPCFCWNSIGHWCGQTCENSHLKWHFWAKTRSKLSPKGGCILPRYASGSTPWNRCQPLLLEWTKST